MPPRVCSFWLMWYDGVITFFKGVICSGAEILACQVCINVCWLYVFVVYFRWLQRTSPTYHKEEPPFTAPRKLPVDPLSLTKEQKEKLSAPGPADCWAVGAKLWFSTVFQDSDCLTAWCNMTHIEILNLNMRRIPWSSLIRHNTAMRNFDSFSIRSTKTRQIMTFCASCEWPWHVHWGNIICKAIWKRFILSGLLCTVSKIKRSYVSMSLRIQSLLRIDNYDNL